MKWYLFALFSLGSFLSSFGQFSDCKEFGLRGPVQRVHTLVYKNVAQRDGQWQLDEAKVFQKMLFEVDTLQNFSEIHIEVLVSDEEKLITDYEFFFEEGKKTKHVAKDQDLNIVEMGTYVWADDRNYKLLVEIGESLHLETKFTLNDNYRDFRGETKAFRKVNNEFTLLYIEAYRHSFDEDGVLQETKIVNLTDGTTKTRSIEYSNYDIYGNALHVTILNEDGSLHSLYRREIEYRQ